MIKQGFILILVLQSFLGCSQTTHEKTMKATAEKLLSYLSKNDTASIMKLYFYDDNDLPPEQAYKEELVRLLETAKLIKRSLRYMGCLHEPVTLLKMEYMKTRNWRSFFLIKRIQFLI